MKKILTCRALAALALIIIVGSVYVGDATAATIVINNIDGAGEGFNDPTVVAALPGNPMTTLGAQRLFAFTYAANLWAACLSSPVTITVNAKMDPQFCDAGSAILGSAGTTTIHRDFTGALLVNTWYPQALANALAGSDLSPGTPDISATFNSNLNGDPGCLGGIGWYYGTDQNPGGDIDFISVVLHEIGHGLGFQTFQSSAGVWYSNQKDAYGTYMYHNGAVPPDYPSMNNPQRAAGNIGDPNLVWNGSNAVTAALAALSSGLVGGRPRLHGPNPYQGGSSLSHWSTGLFPNQLMEPIYTGANHNFDLDIQLLKDCGWTLLPKTPVCQVVPTNIDMGTITVGVPKDTSFTITNTGLGVLSGTVSEACGDYSIVSGAGAYNLSASQSHVVTVRFQPGTAGVKLCTVETGNGICSDVSFTGTGDPLPACLVNPVAIDFDTLFVGSSKDTSFTITNTGGGLLSGNVVACPNYTILAGAGPFSLAGAESLVVSIRFQPLSSGTKLCSVETGTALCSDVACTGVAVDPPACLVNPVAIDFDTLFVGSSKDTSFTIKNTGGGLLAGNVIACPNYIILAGAGPFSLAAAESLVVSIRFQPLSSGTKLCSVETGTALCSDVACTGVGVNPPACLVTPVSIDFDTLLVGSNMDTSFTIKNVGGGVLSGTVSEACVDYEILAGAGAYALAAGESLVVTVRFTPTTADSILCTIETGDSVCSDVALSGVGEVLVGINPVVSYDFALEQNHPNPFNPTTQIVYSLDRDERVYLAIYSVSGKLVRELVNRRQNAGRYVEEWNGRDHRGQSVTSGVYFYRLTAGKRSITRKAVMLK